MRAKLTLTIDERLIERAKAHAQRSGKSVSKLVEDYFELLPEPGKTSTGLKTPIVSSLRGILRNADVDEEDYRRYFGGPEGDKA